MNKYITTILLLIFALSANAQSYQGYQCSQITLAEEAEGYSFNYPKTTISVKLLIEKVVVTPGIYARYAQKYLALRAPLVASTTYNIIDASIDIAGDFDITTKSLSTEPKKVEYGTLPIDQYSSIVLSPDDAARDAAATIFAIRRQRRDIIDGEAGEGYFGAGLKDAMERLDEMERKYIELFMGSKITTQSIEQFAFSPKEGNNRSVVARFDSKRGIVAADDLAGTPIYMQFTPESIPNTSSIEADERCKEPILLRVATPTQCTLYNDSEAITSYVISLYEFGKNIKVDPRKH